MAYKLKITLENEEKEYEVQDISEFLERMKEYEKKDTKGVELRKIKKVPKKYWHGTTKRVKWRCK